MPLFGSNLAHTFTSPVELLPYAVLAALLTLMGIFYVRVFYGSHRLFHRLPIVPHVRPAIGAAIAGLIAIGLLRAFRDDNHALAVLSSRIVWE